MNKYFISFVGINQKEATIGRAVIKTEINLFDEKVIVEIEKDLKKNNKLEKVTLLNFIKL